MKVELGYGDGFKSLWIPEDMQADIMRAGSCPKMEGKEGRKPVEEALLCPIGTGRLRDLAKGRHNIVIITSDITRPMPTWAVMPDILAELKQAGVKPSEITLVFALGSHRGHTKEEKVHLAGEAVSREIRCIDMDPNDFVHMGQTDHGTPVDVTRAVAEADFCICLGNIEYHWFAGYSGGAKAVMPGVSTREAIQINHSLLTDEEAVVGNADSPVRRDLEEAALYCPIDFILNVILDEHKNIIHAVAGHYILAHREGCRLLDEIYGREIDEEADIVVVSQGGRPKDLNLYQMQKALDNARHAVKKGGIIILTGEAGEGLGEPVFEEWMVNAGSPGEILERIRREFRLGGHKAAGFALTMEKAEIFLVSSLEDEFVRSIFMKPYHELQDAFDAAVISKGRGARVLVMPYGGSTLPILRKERRG
ncbi:nickel-dependent lactate racemase [Murimonas intestini]|uniref:nickel-dependent lactate racemase n=1 Tax=Murimonas intestini TaxID=1337051 RepID=UPI0011DD17E8|nr:nickel-dependent lactate racemase [Murimonas intestini]